MKQIGLFAGIGGFELAARWVGWETVAVSEIDPFCQKVLQYHFPGAQLHGDIKTTDFTGYNGQCDIITGGFPCQPFSAAGKRRGTADERYLWPEMLRVIDEVKPRWVIGENVRGLVNWDGGLVFDTVCTELENIGYEVQPFIIPACSVNAPHRRDRIWFVANTTGVNDGHSWNSKNSEIPLQFRRIHCPKLQWGNFPNKPAICGGNDGFPDGLDSITFSKWRKESIKGYGNAIVPQVAYEIYKAIILYEQIGTNNE